jgi:hypothetical protein
MPMAMENLTIVQHMILFGMPQFGKEVFDFGLVGSS